LSFPQAYPAKISEYKFSGNQLTLPPTLDARLKHSGMTSTYYQGVVVSKVMLFFNKTGFSAFSYDIHHLPF
jgi:hypothetical protein